MWTNTVSPVADTGTGSAAKAFGATRTADTRARQRPGQGLRRNANAVIELSARIHAAGHALGPADWNEFERKMVNELETAACRRRAPTQGNGTQSSRSTLTQSGKTRRNFM